jgi:hypothetical protein
LFIEAQTFEKFRLFDSVSSSLDSPFQANHGGTAYKMPGESEQAVHEPGRSRFLQTMKDRLLENGVRKA